MNVSDCFWFVDNFSILFHCNHDAFHECFQQALQVFQECLDSLSLTHELP